MNYIDEAVKVMENGWCVGDLKNKDATGKDVYCAVGAVTEAAGLLAYMVDEETGKPMATWDKDDFIYWVDETVTYANFIRLPEAKALADEVVADTEWLNLDGVEKTIVLDAYKEGEYDVVVFNYNDTNTKEDVIALFRRASERFDKTN